MGSTTAARALLVVGFFAVWIGYDAWMVSHVVLDPGATRAAAHALLEAPAVRSGLADTITAEIERRLPAASNDPRVGPAVAQAMRDPRVEAAFADTIARIHEAVLSDAGATSFTIDGTALTNALYDEIAPTDPQLAAEIRKAPPLDVSIGSSSLPHVHDARPTVNVVFVLATLAALLLVTASLLLRHDRRSIARGRAPHRVPRGDAARRVRRPPPRPPARVGERAGDRGRAPARLREPRAAVGDRARRRGRSRRDRGRGLAPQRDGVRTLGPPAVVAVQRTGPPAGPPDRPEITEHLYL